MAANSKVIALLSVCLSLGTVGSVAVLAIERDRTAGITVDADDLCPPGACTIVMKTGAGGPPSVVQNVPVPASTVPPATRTSPVLVASADRVH